MSVIEVPSSSVPGHEGQRFFGEDLLVAELTRTFRPRLQELLAQRVTRQAAFDRGEGWDFLPDTREVREGDWTCAKAPSDLQDRRVEITGPVDRKMVINALNSGANVFMADFEDSTCPTWENVVAGQVNLFDAVRRTISFEQSGKQYELAAKTAVLFVRPRGLHLPEAHVRVDGQPVPGPLFDFGLFVFHNAKELIARGSGPYFYLPKLESHLEARLWRDVLLHAERALGLAEGTCRATVLIETLPAAFQMHEILHELRAHSVGLNCGRWDYIFSAITRRRADAAAVMPDRAQITMDKGFLRAYSELLIQTCHRRGVHAMGGMAAQIPIKNDTAKNEAALARVRADKLREVRAGHDGTWVAHPALIPVARAIFDAHMPTPHQHHVLREDVHATRDDLIRPSEGTITREGFENNIEVCVRYMAAWLDGNGCVPIHWLMEDAATAEIARAQLWQWLHHSDPRGRHADGSPVHLADGTVIDFALFERALAALPGRLGDTATLPGGSRIPEAIALLDELTRACQLVEFLTLPAYARID